MYFTILPSDRVPLLPPDDLKQVKPSKSTGVSSSLYGRQVSLQRQIEQTVQNASVIASNLNLLRERLLVEFGQTSQSFIARSIDPMVQHANKIIKELSSSDPGQPDSEVDDVLKGAIESVRLYAQFNDEKKLRKKIVSETVATTRSAMDKDCEILRNYELHFLQTELLLTPDRDKVEQLLSEKLGIIFREFSKLRAIDCDSDDLRELFLWKSKIDSQRGALTELGLLTIDSILQHPTRIPLETEEEEEVAIPRQKDMVDEMLDRAQNLVRLVENGLHFEEPMFDELTRLTTDLKNEMRTIEPNITDEFQDAFNSVQDTIHHLDILMQRKQKER